MLDHPFSEEIFVIMQFKPSLEQIETLSLYLRLSEQNSLPLGERAGVRFFLVQPFLLIFFASAALFKGGCLSLAA